MATGDPARVHEEGRRVRAAIEDAREQLALLLGVRPRQVVFTSGGTESANAAVWGAVRARPGSVVLCAGIEHSAVRDASARLAPVETLPVDGSGRLELDALADALGRHDECALVHCQAANHEVGTIQPVAEVVDLCHGIGVPVHVDAAAACGHVDLDLGELGADLVSLSAHKLGGIPGTGALVIGRGQRFEPLLVGGSEERGRRAGAENVAGIVAFGAAAEALTTGNRGRLHAEEAAARSKIAELVRAAASVPGVEVVGDRDPSGRLPHLVCLGVAGVEAEPVLLGLDRAGIAAHSGSACSSESLEPSPVLEAMGADPSHSLRVSVGWDTTDGDLAAFSDAFPSVVGQLRALAS